MEKENLILRIGRYGMCKLQVVIAFNLSLCLLTACTQTETDTETIHNSTDASNQKIVNSCCDESDTDSVASIFG